MELEAQFSYTDLYFYVLTVCEGHSLSRVKQRNKDVQVQAGWELSVTPTPCLHISECLTHPEESRETTSLRVGNNIALPCTCPDTDSTAYPCKLVNILALETMTSSLPLRSVNYSDSIKSLWFPSLSSDSKVSWCSCSSGMEWHSPIEVSGIILPGFFIPTWGSGVLLRAFGSTTANCIMDNASTRMSIFGFEGKGQPASLDTFLSATRQSMPGKLLAVRLPLSFAFSK